jgi:cytochrome b
VSGAAGRRRSATGAVWDPLVRVFDWTVAAAIGIDFFVLDDGRYWHRAIGYTAAAALAVRIVWGFVGTRHARFADFWPTPRTVARHFRALLSGEDRKQLGHSPLGAVVMLLLMAILASISITGWMMRLDAFWGAEWLEEVHEVLADAIIVVASLHILAAIVESWRHHENLIWAMVTGKKRASAGDACPADRGQRPTA